MSLRIKFIQFLLHINEKMIFYPRLSSYYKSAVGIKNPVIFDVGANKGQSISFFLKLFPQSSIFAFEPNYKLYKKLSKKFGHLSNVQLVNKGVSNQNGKLVLQETVTDETSTFEELNYDSDYLKMKARVLGIKPKDIVADSYEVEVIRLSDFIEEQKLQKIHVLKIDTEGHELKCLKGLFTGLTKNVELIQLEHHHDDMYLNAISDSEITKLLKANDFELDKKVRHGFGDFEELLFKKERKPNR